MRTSSGVRRVDVDADVVARSADQRPVPRHDAPCAAAIIGTPERSLLLRLDERVDALRIGGRDRDVDLADGRFRQAVLELLPRRAGVSGHVDRAAGAAALLRPRVQLDLPHAGEQHIRIVRIHRQAGTAGVRIGEERSLPGLAAVGRLEHAALRLRPRRAAERADIDDVRIRGCDDDAADAARSAASRRSSTSSRRRSTCRRRRRSCRRRESSTPLRCRPRRCSDRTGRRRARRSPARADRRIPARTSWRHRSSSRRRPTRRPRSRSTCHPARRRRPRCARRSQDPCIGIARGATEVEMGAGPPRWAKAATLNTAAQMLASSSLERVMPHARLGASASFAGT